MRKALIKAESLSKVFAGKNKGETRALYDVSFELYEGETLGIVGESGSGKSTLAKLVCGLMPPSSGSVWVGRTNVGKAGRKERLELYARMQMVFQDSKGSFDSRRTLGDGIGESLRNRKLPKEEIRRRVEELLTDCGLSGEFADRYPREVSGGECQRAAIARALAIKPEILILDEATSALDVTVQAQIIGLLKRLREERGLSILFICHNIALVQQFCDRVLVLKEGRVLESGMTDELLSSPQNPYTRALIEAVF
ncbi:MAG: ATP-binding cassette domain-containing protein [Lachnospiraceae bacterium]|nr:ATP-binding cassette domain-containing protein [Lachnospiraceae bacterium]